MIEQRKLIKRIMSTCSNVIHAFIDTASNDIAKVCAIFQQLSVQFTVEPRKIKGFIIDPKDRKILRKVINGKILLRNKLVQK